MFATILGHIFGVFTIIGAILLIIAMWEYGKRCDSDYDDNNDN